MAKKMTGKAAKPQKEAAPTQPEVEEVEVEEVEVEATEELVDQLPDDAGVEVGDTISVPAAAEELPPVKELKEVSKPVNDLGEMLTKGGIYMALPPKQKPIAKEGKDFVDIFKQDGSFVRRYAASTHGPAYKDLAHAFMNKFTKNGIR